MKVLAIYTCQVTSAVNDESSVTVSSIRDKER